MWGIGAVGAAGRLHGILAWSDRAGLQPRRSLRVMLVRPRARRVFWRRARSRFAPMGMVGRKAIMRLRKRLGEALLTELLRRHPPPPHKRQGHQSRAVSQHFRQGVTRVPHSTFRDPLRFSARRSFLLRAGGARGWRGRLGATARGAPRFAQRDGDGLFHRLLLRRRMAAADAAIPFPVMHQFADIGRDGPLRAAFSQPCGHARLLYPAA